MKQYFLLFLQYYLLNLYNRVRLDAFVEMRECNGTTIPQKIVPLTYTMERLDSLYSEEYFLELYFETRFIEEESIFTDSEKGMLIDDCVEISLAHGTKAALDAFERILNKPFDYRGSLGYIREYLDSQAAEGF